jgi:hypothetical protein
VVEIALLLFLLFLLAVYFFPTFLAGLRGHHATVGIFAVNLLLGWTAIGWIVALLWAFAPVRPAEDIWEEGEESEEEEGNDGAPDDPQEGAQEEIEDR